MRPHARLANILVNDRPELLLDRDIVSRVCRLADESPLGTARACLHHTDADPVHQMIIAHRRGFYIRPRRFLQKTLSYHLIEGSMRFFLFDDQGKPRDSWDLAPLGTASAEHPFGFRIEPLVWYSAVVLSDRAVFHEILTGPFTGPADAEFPPWAPPLPDLPAVSDFLALLGFPDHPIISGEGA